MLGISDIGLGNSDRRRDGFVSVSLLSSRPIVRTSHVIRGETPPTIVGRISDLETNRDQTPAGPLAGSGIMGEKSALQIIKSWAIKFRGLDTIMLKLTTQ